MIKTFDLSSLGLSEGTHSIQVRAKAKGYADSSLSEAVSYTVAPVMYRLARTIAHKTFDLSTLGLAEGAHYVQVRARAKGFTDSELSESVAYVVRPIQPVEPIQPIYRYVTLGDSVGAGYGVENDEDDFTGLLHTQLESIYGSNNVSTQNKAIGGHKIPDLMARLDEEDVYDAVRNANLVTISIGGNDMLFPAFEHLEDYIFSGDSALAQMTADCTNTLNNTLAKDDYPTSYNNLFKKLVSINPNAKICFTTQYNPYKYLWAEEGENGFFRPLFDTLPDNLGLGGTVLKSFVREGFFGMELVKNFFNRINGLGAWVENLVSELNKTLKLKMGEFNNENFFVAETKALYDSIPDRQGAGEVHYNDLVHVEYTRGYNFGNINWGKLWDNTRITDKDGNVLSNTVCNSAYDFWSTLISVYWNGSSIDTNGLVETLLYMVAELIVMPDVDLHPKEDGYYLLMRSFAETLRNNVSELSALPALNTITYNANGGTGYMATQKVLDICRGKRVYSITKPNSFSPVTGYHFACWEDGNGSSYSNEQAIHVGVNANLYAQWSNLYTVTFRHSKDSAVGHDDSNTGPQECYALWIEGVEQADLGAFSNPARTYTLPYGTAIGVIAQTAMGSARSYVKFNGETVAETSSDARWGFNLTGHTDIHFEWNYFLAEALPTEQSYWNCYITTK